MKTPKFNKDLFGNSAEEKKKGKIAERFLTAPFTVLDTRLGWWIRRKQAWLKLGIQSELGRETVPGGGGPNSCMHRTTGKYGKKKQKLPPGGGGGGCWRGGKQTESSGKYNREKDKAGSGTSVFDPVLTELCCRWFCPLNGQILDPFAGGSVRGIVSTICGYNYWGCELRKEQIEANIEQRKLICPDTNLKWVCGDSNLKLKEAPQADLLLSCPPYGNLEVYSNDPADISNMPYEQFQETYRSIIAKSCARLRENRFACFVVSDYRRKDGCYQGFVRETVEAFKRAGLQLWNEFVVVKAIGSLPIRMTKPFNLNRKAGRMHENLLVFIKGKGLEAAKVCGEVNTEWNL